MNILKKLFTRKRKTKFLPGDVIVWSRDKESIYVINSIYFDRGDLKYFYDFTSIEGQDFPDYWSNYVDRNCELANDTAQILYGRDNETYSKEG